MTTSIPLAACAAALLLAGAPLARAGDASATQRPIQYAQMNSPGDGLDSDAAADGNGRPRKMSGMKRRKAGRMQMQRRMNRTR